MDEIELVRRCQRGNTSAFEALYQLYLKRALRTAFLLTRSRAAAEDAVQETFVQVWRRVSTLRQPAAFRPWFYRVLLNTIHRLSRREHRMAARPLAAGQHDQPDLTNPLPEERVERAEELAALRCAISALGDPHRLPLALRYYTGLSEAEVAEVLDIPLGTVKSRLHNAKQALHRMLSLPDTPRTAGKGE